MPNYTLHVIVFDKHIHIDYKKQKRFYFKKIAEVTKLRYSCIKIWNSLQQKKADFKQKLSWKSF